MRKIVLLDTSVYLNILNVPGRNQQREQVFDDFSQSIKEQSHFLLPMATIWETGNHISRLPNGDLRYQYASLLAKDVQGALRGETPYQHTYFPDEETFGSWVNEFPEFARCNKSVQKTTEGISLSDLSIIKEWQRTKQLNPRHRVLIWSLDSDLAGYDTGKNN